LHVLNLLLRTGQKYWKEATPDKKKRREAKTAKTAKKREETVFRVTAPVDSGVA
jgi:hypothetical protein